MVKGKPKINAPPIIECEVINPFCSKCGAQAVSCDFPAEIEGATIAFKDGKMSVTALNNISIVNTRISQIKLKCPNGHTWERDHPSKYRTSGL